MYEVTRSSGLHILREELLQVQVEKKYVEQPNHSIEHVKLCSGEILYPSATCKPPKTIAPVSAH